MIDPKKIIGNLDELKNLEKKAQGEEEEPRTGPKVHLDPDKQSFYDELTDVTLGRITHRQSIKGAMSQFLELNMAYLKMHERLDAEEGKRLAKEQKKVQEWWDVWNRVDLRVGNIITCSPPVDFTRWPAPKDPNYMVRYAGLQGLGFGVYVGLSALDRYA